MYDNCALRPFGLKATLPSPGKGLEEVSQPS